MLKYKPKMGFSRPTAKRNCWSSIRSIPTSLDFEKKYLGRVKDALEHAESFETDLNRLENHIGSNLGNLLRELNKNSRV